VVQVAQVVVAASNHQQKALAVLLVHQVKVLQEAEPLLQTLEVVAVLAQQEVMLLQVLAVLVEMVEQHQ
jgi:hypothetical protein